MSCRHTNSLYNWCLTGTLAGSLLLGGSVTSQAGPFSLPKPKAASQAQTDMQKQLEQQQRAADLTAAGIVENDPVSAEESSANAAARIAHSARTIKLNFIEASWRSVLSSYAKQAGMPLEADPSLLPSPRFTRPDRSDYTQAVALKIINRELFRYDLKVDKEEKKLVLKDIHRTAPNYRRPSVDASGMITSHELPNEPGAKHQLMARYLGIRRDFLHGRDKRLGPAHGRLLSRQSYYNEAEVYSLSHGE